MANRVRLATDRSLPGENALNPFTTIPQRKFILL
jgi:hypothetical protein